MIRWRGVDAMGERFADLAEVREASGSAGAWSFDPSTEVGEYVEVAPPGASSTWGVGDIATAYVDRDRVWLDGSINTTGGSSALGTLPAGKRPSSTVFMPCTFANDQLGSVSYEAGAISVAGDGTATLYATVSLTGTLSIILTGLSFKVAP